MRKTNILYVNPPKNPDKPPVGSVIIAGVLYTHASRRVNQLFDEVVCPALEEGGYKRYGIKSQLVKFIRQYGYEHYFSDVAAFLDTFMPWLKTRERPTRGGSYTPVLKTFEVSRMSRPPWPKDYTLKLGAVAGDNIRHVVRNATLKRALEIEWGRSSPAALEVQKKYFADMAALLGISIEKDASLDLIIPAIYKALYLNEDNLFAGDGPTNQIIGFAADGMQSIGEEYLGMDNDAAVNMLDVLKRISEHIYTKSEMVRASQYYKQEIVSGLLETITQALSSLVSANGDVLDVPAQIVGDLVSDMGLNFGFDLIDGRRKEDQENIGSRQGRLLRVEQALQTYISRDGQGMSLLNIFSEFLGRGVDKSKSIQF
ncbi:hypothetical protein GCM10027093_74050 [Paraburkholderia jirisanensis]